MGRCPARRRSGPRLLISAEAALPRRTAATVPAPKRYGRDPAGPSGGPDARRAARWLGDAADRRRGPRPEADLPRDRLRRDAPLPRPGRDRPGAPHPLAPPQLRGGLLRRAGLGRTGV